MNVNADLMIVLAIGLMVLLACVRLLFWARRWRVAQWFESFDRSMCELADKSKIVSELASRCFNSMSRMSHRDLYQVTAFVTQIESELPRWRTLMASSGSIGEIEELCLVIEATLEELCQDSRHDPLELMHRKLQNIAGEIAMIADQPAMRTFIVGRVLQGRDPRDILNQYGLLGNDS